MKAYLEQQVKIDWNTCITFRVNILKDKIDGLIKVACYLYNTKSVTITLKDHLMLKDKYYVEDESVRVPFWYAKLLYRRGITQPIRELIQYEKRFLRAIADQKINRSQLITVDQDFYFEFFDYFKHILKKENDRHEKLKKLKEFKNQRASIIMNLLRMEKPDMKQIMNMTFEESIFYVNTIKNKNQPYLFFNKLTQEGGDNVVE